MNLVRTVLAVLVAAGLTASAGAADKADLKKQLVGKWEAVKADEGALPKGSTIEMMKDGKLKVVAKKGGEEMSHDGTYVVDGDSIKVTTTTADGKERSFKVKIDKISDTEMEATTDQGKKNTFKKVK